MKQMVYIPIGIQLAVIILSILANIDASASNLITEDRVWEYLNSEMQPDYSRRFSRYKFSGTEERNGIIYNRLMKFYESGLVQELSSDNRWQSRPVENFDEECVALMREEDEKVYLLLDPDNDYAIYDPTSEDQPIGETFEPWIDPVGGLRVLHSNQMGINGLAENEEVILYDFSHPRQSYRSNTKVLITSFCYNDRAFCNVISNTIPLSSGTINIRGNDYEEFVVIPEYLNDVNEKSGCFKDQKGDFELIYTREFGNIGRGTLYELTNNESFGGESGIWQEEEIRLNRVLDLEGNVLYSTPDTQDPSAIYGIHRDFNQNLMIYDLMGREIRDPQPGTVYIRGGKKYVAK